jgi:hypothetical protein
MMLSQLESWGTEMLQVLAQILYELIESRVWCNSPFTCLNL